MTIKVYLIDEDGNRVVDEDGNYIVLEITAVGDIAGFGGFSGFTGLLIFDDR